MNWEDDKLNRKVDADYLRQYVLRKYKASKHNSLSINLNAEWGQGKTYFLKNLERDLSESGHPVVYYDAWQNDFSNEALVSFISEISDMLSETIGVDPAAKNKVDLFKEKGKKLLKSALPIILSAVAKHLFKTDDINNLIADDGDAKSKGESNLDLSDTVSALANAASTSLLEQHKETQKSIKEFSSALSDLVSVLAEKKGKLKDKELPIFVLVDELDRCRPTFAIELLESIKHLFGVQGIVFITATNTKELQASIKAVYGSEFSAKAYLKRFFELEYSFKKPSLKEFCRLVISDIEFDSRVHSYALDGNDDFESALELFCAYCEYFKVPLRDIEQLGISLEACVYTTKDSIELPLLLFLLILKQLNYDKEFYKLRENGRYQILDSFFDESTFEANVSLKTYSDSRDGFRVIETEISIKDVLNIYFSNVGQTMERLSYDSEIREIVHKITNNLRKTLSGPQPFGQRKQVSYQKYFEMAQHAGQFSDIG